MKCPFSGKPCLFPKEICVELADDPTQSMFLCHRCGDEYIKNLEQDSQIITKSLDVVSNEGGVSHREHIIDELLLTSDADEPVNPDEIDSSQPKQVPLMPQIKKIEAKMQDAINQENYEDAALLRDIMEELKKKYNDDPKPEDG